MAEKNYNQYWKVLKEKKTLQLQFQFFIETGTEIRYNLQLWKAGISKCKSRDSAFNRRNPDMRVEYDVQQQGENTHILTCTLINSINYFSPNGPTILE